MTDSSSLIGFSMTTCDAARVVVGEAQLLVAGDGLEAPADDLEQAAADEHVLGAAAQALGDGQHADRAAPARQRRGQLVVDAVQARDLLDEVGLAGDVVAAEVRHRDVEAVGALGGLKAQAPRGAARSPSA